MRIAQKELSINSLNASNAFSLLTYFSGNSPSKAAELMKIPYPDWYKTFGQYLVKIDSLSETSNSNSKWNPIMSRIFEKCFSNDGAMSDWIVNKWGVEIGLNAAKTLETKGWIKKVGNSYFPCKRESIESDHSNNLSLISAQLNEVEPSGIDKNMWYLNTIHTLPSSFKDKLRQNRVNYNLRQKEIIEEAKKSTLPHDKIFIENLFGYIFRC